MRRKNSERVLGLYVFLMMVFLALPIAIVIPSAFSNGTALTFPPQGFSLRWFAAIAERPALVAATINSAAIALVATSISLVVGTLSAFTLSRRTGPSGRSLLMRRPPRAGRSPCETPAPRR
jgi:ABC-type spermidine/putrescine transport system permease subunit II